MSEENERRADRARAALEAYAAARNENGDESHLRDLLADLMHYCKAERVDFNRALATAQMHFEYEA